MRLSQRALRRRKLEPKMKRRPKKAPTYRPALAGFQVVYAGRTPREQRVWSENYLQIASFDPAELNPAVRIERRFSLDPQGQAVRLWSNTPEVPAPVPGRQLWPRVNGQAPGPDPPAASAYRTYIQPLCHLRINLRGDNISATLLNFDRFLQQIHFYLIGCHLIIIERQMIVAPDNIRVMQHIQTWCICHLSNGPLLPDIIEVEPRWVKEIMGLQIGNRKGNKTIMPYRIRALLFFYGETQGRQILSAAGKKDDLADVIAQIEAVCRTLSGLPHNIDPGTFQSWASLDVAKQHTALGACK